MRVTTDIANVSKGVYVTGIEGGSGKILVVLGLMEHLGVSVERVSFFRPIRRTRHGRDPSLDLITARYPLAVPEEDAFGLTADEARALITEGRADEALDRILVRYKAVEEASDFVVCEGTDFSGIAPTMEGDWNATLAKDFGIPVTVVVRAAPGPVGDTVDILRLSRATFESADCSLAGLIVNRVPAERMDAFRDALDAFPWGDEPVFLVPDVPLLARPTIGDVAGALRAKWLWGKREGEHRDVLDVLVAAMQVPNFLPHLCEGSLVIVPGDREDVLLASVLTTRSETYPGIAGVLLTGGLTPSKATSRLLEGLPGETVPVLQVEGDTYETATAVRDVQPVPRPENEGKIAAALGLFAKHVSAEAIVHEIEVSRPTVVTPRMFEHTLLQRAIADPRHIVLPEGLDDRILKASRILRLREVAHLTLLGDPTLVRRRAEDLGVDLGDIPIVDPVASELRGRFAEEYHELRRHKGVTLDSAYDLVADVSLFGTMMVLDDLADGMVSGAAHTTQHTIRPALQIIKTAPGANLVSSVFFMCLPDRVLVFGDCAVNPNPTSEQLADIAIQSAETAARFGVKPRVAMLSYSTGASGRGEDVERVRRATQIAKARRPDLLLDGPMQYDAAIDPGVARTKMAGSPVAGRATVYIFPDLNTGNNTYKAVQRSAHAVAVGPVLQGLKKPVNDLSRGCTVPDVVNTVALTAIQAQSPAVVS